MGLFYGDENKEAEKEKTCVVHNRRKYVTLKYKLENLKEKRPLGNNESGWEENIKQGSNEIGQYVG